MRWSAKVILVTNPRTGSGTLAEGMRLNGHLHGVQNRLPEYPTPKEIRRTIGEEQWQVRKKIVIVRDPQSRFNSAAQAFEAMGEGERMQRYGRELSEWMVATLHRKELTAAHRAALLGEYLQGLKPGEVPRLFLPQSMWLASRFDVVLTTDNIGAYLSSVCKVSARKMNATPAVKFPVAATEALVRSIYHDDHVFFSRLRVWHPDPETVALLKGPCAACTYAWTK